MRKHLILSLAFFIINTLLYGQVVEVSPANPTADDTVTITFHADAGNKALMNYSGEVYIHTGVIIGTAEEPSGWRYVQGDWGKPDARVRMTPIAQNTFEFSFPVRSFYGFAADEPFLQLAMVFRNADGTLVAKEAGDKDIFYPNIKTYPNGILEAVSGENGIDVGDFKEIQETTEGITLIGTKQALLITHYTDDIVSVSLRPYRREPVEFKIANVLKPTTWVKRVQDVGETILVDWGTKYGLEITKKPIRLKFFYKGAVVLEDEKGCFEDKKLQIAGTRLKLQGREHIYGAGSRAINIDRRGNRLFTYNTASFGYTQGETRLNMSIPFIQSSRGAGIFFDNPRSGYLDIGKKEEDVLEFGVRDSALTYYLVMGETPDKVVENYTLLTGRQSLPPLWSLGFMQSRFGYKSQAETEEIVERTLKAGYPLEAILMDLYWFGETKDMGNLTFDRNNFSNPQGMVKKLNDQGVKTILITESYFCDSSFNYDMIKEKGWFPHLANGEPARIPDFWAGPASLLDIYQPEAQKWFWGEYKRIKSTYKTHGWWCDSGEPENHPKRMIHSIGKAEDVHNLYPLYWAKMIDENHRKDFPNERLFNLSRSGYAGVQRYNIFPWSGDVSRSWEAMRAQTSIMLGAGVSGIGYMHSDLGGFTGGPLNEELYYRWLQMGAFVPVMRAHGSGLPSEPVFFSPQTQAIVKNAIRLRYALLPYNYSLCWENHTKGLPLTRPMYMYYPKDENAAKVDDAYFWGENLLVAPIFEQGATQRTVYLPKGQWFDFHSTQSYKGGGNVTVPVSLETIPVFVKAGACIPTIPTIQHTSKYLADTLLLNCFPDISAPSSSSNIYTDDGTTPDAYAKSYFALMQYESKVVPGKVDIDFKQTGSYPGMPQKRVLIFGINNIQKVPFSLIINGKNIKILPGNAIPKPNIAFYDAAHKRLMIMVIWDNMPLSIKISGKTMLP